MTAGIEVARHAEAPGVQISRVPDDPPQPRPASLQRDAILIVILLSAAANLAAKLAPVALFAIVLAASRGLVRDSQVIPRALTWYFGPAPAWVRRRRNRRNLRQQMLDAPARLGVFMPTGNPIDGDARTMDRQSQMRLDEPWWPACSGRRAEDNRREPGRVRRRGAGSRRGRRISRDHRVNRERGREGARRAGRGRLL